MHRAHDDATQRPIWAGTSGPATGTPPRRPGSFRRTSTVDMQYPEGLSPLLLHGSARDLRTDDRGVTSVLDVASLEVVVDTSADPVIREATVPELVGLPAMAGYRRRVQGVAESGSVLALLVDEVPTVTLISGSSLARTGRRPDATSGDRHPPVDTCAGWIAGGAMIGVIERGEQPFLGEGPPAGDLDDANDPLAWHELAELPIGAMRRRRRLDVHDGDVDVLFRDSVVESSGIETVVHEYGISARIDVVTRVITAIEAHPHVLPGPQCPNAAASADVLVGMRLDDVRDHVRRHFLGTSTCTHLNDALRSLGDLFRFVR